MLHRTDIAVGDVWFLRPGVPHCLGPDVMFIEIQQPSDLSVVPEHWTVGADETGASMGLGWDVGLRALDYATGDREAALAEARQTPELVEELGESRVWGLMGPAARRFFDVQRLEVADVLPVTPGRFERVHRDRRQRLARGRLGSPRAAGGRYVRAARRGRRAVRGGRRRG